MKNKNNPIRTIQVSQTTAKRVQIAKQTLGCANADETINRVFDIMEKLGSAE